MTALFADSYYWYALGNLRDVGHGRAVMFSQSAVPIITTAWIITELADGLCRSRNRRHFLRLLDLIRGDPFHTIVPAEPGLMEKGLDLYRARTDKDWSLTDCISFVTMADHGLTEALTADHHYEQAGFKAMLK